MTDLPHKLLVILLVSALFSPMLIFTSKRYFREAVQKLPFEPWRTWKEQGESLVEKLSLAVRMPFLGFYLGIVTFIIIGEHVAPSWIVPLGIFVGIVAGLLVFALKGKTQDESKMRTNRWIGSSVILVLIFSILLAITGGFYMDLYKMQSEKTTFTKDETEVKRYVEWYIAYHGTYYGVWPQNLDGMVPELKKRQDFSIIKLIQKTRPFLKWRGSGEYYMDVALYFGVTDHRNIISWTNSDELPITDFASQKLFELDKQMKWNSVNSRNIDDRLGNRELPVQRKD